MHDAPGADLVEELEQLATLSLRERSPFLGLVAPLLSHANVPLRRAALRVLAGARGMVGMRAIAAGMDDEDSTVRVAAVEAWREVGKHEYVRWAHAIFHPRVDVRAAALVGEVHANNAHYGAFLRADPANRALAEALPMPSPAIALVLGLWRRGAIEPDDAATHLGKAMQSHLRDWIEGSRRRSAEAIRAFIRQKTTTIAGQDALDDWVDIMCAASEEPAGKAVKAMAEAILAGRLADSRPRLTVAIVKRGLERGFDELTDALLGVAAVCEPRLLSMAICPAEERRRAANGIIEHRTALQRPSTALVLKLLRSDLATLPDGTPDLRFAVACAWLLGSDRLATLVERYGDAALLAAIPRDLPSWAALCDLPEEAPRWATRFLDAALQSDPATGLTLHAIALGRFAMHDRAMLDRTLDAAERAGPLIVEIVVQAQAGLVPSTPQVVGRLGNRLASRATMAELPVLFAALVERLDKPVPEAAVLMLAAVAGECDPGDFALAIATMPVDSIVALLGAIGDPVRLRANHEAALVEALGDTDDERVVAWVEAARVKLAPSKDRPRTSGTPRTLTDEEADVIATASLDELDDALTPALGQPSVGLAAALERRRDTGDTHVGVCTALIGCADPAKRVSALLDQWHGDDAEFDTAVLQAVTRVWGKLERAPWPSPWLTHGWLHAFEPHAFALAGLSDDFAGGLVGALKVVDALPGALARRKMWEAFAATVTLRRYRQRAALIAKVTPHLDDLLAHIITQLDTDVGVSAAKLLVSLHLGGMNVVGARKQVLQRAPDMDRETVHELARLVRVDGLPLRATAARRRHRSVGERRLDEIRQARDLDELEARCRSRHPKVVLVAAQRLVNLGTLGERRLAALLSGQPPVAGFTSIAATIPDWTDRESLEVAAALARDASTPARMQYRLAVAMHDRGEPGWMVTILKALRVPTDEPWFPRDEWDALVKRSGVDARVLALELTESAHPHVYRNAIELLLSQPIDADTLAAFRKFLEQSSLRPADLRRAVAFQLNEHGDPLGLPILMSAITDSEKGWEQWLFTPPTPELARALGELLLASTLYGGPGACDEHRLLALLDKLEVPSEARAEINAQLLADARNAKVCQRVVQSKGLSTGRYFKILEIADTFAWGVRRGRELTGRLFRVHMTWRRGDYGHTYLDSNSIHVTPLPMLRGDRDGRDVVEALILHEFGHHMYHRGPEPQGVWGRATSEGLGHLLNLVADEHLERNLRALRPEYGDRLKRLASYAFQHNDREMTFDPLLVMLGASAFDALSREPIGLAFDARCIRVHSGNLLRELERVGNPFARFVRALRQGLGNRHEDPLVEEALELFRHRFRHSSMAQMYTITKRLQELFGIEAKLAQQIGGHETIKGTGREAAAHGEDISDGEVQREVERILDPRQLDRMRGVDDGSAPRKLAVNVIEDDSFKKITDIQRVAPNPDKHREISTEVRRHADRVRRYFTEMGLNYVPQRARMRGRAFDKTRARAVVLRRDPRMLVARELSVTTDLFIAVVVDCSGSMRTGGSMDKAHRFGVLLADAIRGLSNVDARFFGFTDKVIYDAGDQRQCAVAALETSGGNNDAAALYHAAATAERSRRRSKLIVMISDGLPTECSAVALRALATRITQRQGILCAQVAVRPLSEICFQHYVEIKPGDPLDVAVRRFGEIVSRLAKRALGR
ncbi:MAG: hypothetical protein AAF721_14785 [Myxococcota bacterium]